MIRDRECRWGLALVLAVGCGALGCGPSHPETAPVSGRVTVGGEPVAQGRIAFYPEQGRMAQGTLDADGRYTLTTFEPNDGAMLGPHRVVITATHVSGPQPPQTLAEELAGGGGTASGRLQWLAPEVYSQRETTPLTAAVEAGENEINFDLPAGN